MAAPQPIYVFLGVLLSYCSGNTGIPDPVSGKGGSKAPCVGEEAKMETKRELKRLKEKFKRVFLQALVSWSSGQAVSIKAPTPTHGTHALIKRYSISCSNLRFPQELLIVSICLFKFMLSFHFIISPQRQTQNPMLGPHRASLLFHL